MDLTQRLPSEILSHTFILVQADSPILRPAGPPHSLLDAWSPRVPTHVVNNHHAERPDWGTRYTYRLALAWIRLITHVCGRWRSIALSTQALWARPTIYLGLTWFEEMIRRSGKAMLSLSGRECGLSSGNAAVRIYMAEVLQRITQVHAQRIGSLKLENSYGLSLMLQPFQTLEEFEAKSITTDLSQWGISTSVLEIFSGHAPCLRSLVIAIQSIRYRQLPGRSPIWNNLRHIHLSLSGPLVEAGFDSPILRALSRAHALRTCTLKSGCENPHQDGTNSALECDTCSQSVVLPDTVTHFEVHGCAHMFTHFLAHVRFHPATNVQIHSTCPGSMEAPAIPYLDRALSLRHCRGPSARALAIIEKSASGDEYHQSELCLSSSPDALLLYHRLRDGVDDGRNSNNTQFTLELHSTHIRELLPHLSDTLILTITRSWQGPGGPSLLTRANICSFVYLRHLNLSCTDLRTLIPILDVQDIDGRPCAIALPCLASLSIGGHGIWDFISVTGFNESIAVRLRRALCSRATAGKPVRPVFIHIKEELGELRAGNWDRTSCSKYMRNIDKMIREGLEELFAIVGINVVSYNSVYVLNEDGLTGRLVQRNV